MPETAEFDDDDDGPSPIDSHARPDTGPPIDSHGDGLREAASEVRQQRDAESGDPAHIRPPQPSLEDGNVPHEEPTEIQYLDRANAPEKVSVKKAATDLADYRAQQKQAAEDELAIERMQTTEADPQQRAAEQRQWEAQQQAQQQPQELTPEQRVQHERAQMLHSQLLYEQATAKTLQVTRAMFTTEFGDLQTDADVARLANTDPVKFSRLQQLAGLLKQNDQELRRMQARRHEETAEQFQQYAKYHDDRAVQEIPELQRPEIKDHFKNAALETLRERGFADDELSRGYHGKGVFSLRDSRVQAVIADAVRWRQAQGKARSVTTKPLPPVQRPGVAQSRYDHASGEIASLSQRLGRTGNLKDAARLLAAQRRAGR